MHYSVVSFGSVVIAVQVDHLPESESEALVDFVVVLFELLGFD